MSEFWEAMGVTPIRPQPLSMDCGCCAGGIDGVGLLCPGCEAAIIAGDRRGHPHELSAAQLDLIARRGEHGGGMDYVDAIGVQHPDGTVTLVAVVEKDAEEWPDGHPCRNCGQLAKDHIDSSDPGLQCEGWR